MSEVHTEEPKADILVLIEGRARYLAHLGHVKTPEILRGCAAEITRLRAALAEKMAVKVKPLEWENFDAWEFWARSSVGTYYVRERNGIWKTTLDTRSSDALIYEYTTDGLTPNDFEAGRQAAQADFERRVLDCITVRKENE